MGCRDFIHHPFIEMLSDEMAGNAGPVGVTLFMVYLVGKEY